ncbi:hypothetical protein GSI16_004247 [Salmonella enterica]|nr:hypothetical protein [Salmonella enterica subsp. enterica serovar Abony]EEH0121771.1 hypothetical protein [Salmonella enterica]
MTKSVFKVRISKSVGEELIPYIEEIIPAEARKMGVRARVGDSAPSASSPASVILGYIFEFIQNKDVCYSVAAVVAAWIRAKHSKKIIIKKGGYKIEASNLTDEELFKLFSEAKDEIEIKKE